MKYCYEVEYWVDKEARNAGLGDILGSYNTLKEAKHAARNLYDSGSCDAVEVLKHIDEDGATVEQDDGSMLCPDHNVRDPETYREWLDNLLHLYEMEPDDLTEAEKQALVDDGSLDYENFDIDVEAKEVVFSLYTEYVEYLNTKGMTKYIITKARKQDLVIKEDEVGYYLVPTESEVK